MYICNRIASTPTSAGNRSYDRCETALYPTRLQQSFIPQLSYLANKIEEDLQLNKRISLFARNYYFVVFVVCFFFK